MSVRTAAGRIVREGITSRSPGWLGSFAIGDFNDHPHSAAISTDPHGLHSIDDRQTAVHEGRPFNATEADLRAIFGEEAPIASRFRDNGLGEIERVLSDQAHLHPSLIHGIADWDAL